MMYIKGIGEVKGIMRGRRMQLNLEQLKEITQKYFKEQDQADKPYTVVGYARRLGIDRNTLLNYENENVSFFGMNDEEINEFISTIKNAKLKIEEQLEERLLSGGNVTGTIFNLKNNYGYVDKQEISSTNNNINVNNNLLQSMSKTELLQLVDQLNNKTGKE